MALFRPPPSLLTASRQSPLSASSLKKSASCKARSKRTFISGLPNLNLTPPLQHISASRTLPYPHIPIFQTIANVPQYATFLPYCLSSTITRWSNEDALFHQRWPEEAVLEIGWGAVRERFTSRIYCVPGRVVEAVAGAAKPSVDERQVPHHTHVAGAHATDESGNSDILTHLMTRWEVHPLETKERQDSTQVTLNIEFQFANPMYAAMSQVAAGAVAEKMIEAFEKRIREEMTSSGNLNTESNLGTDLKKERQNS